MAINQHASSTTAVQTMPSLSSDMDLALFRAWQTSAPGFIWKRAVVDRYDGLTLYGEGEYALRFAHALCGYGGTGPVTSAYILHEAGFGSLRDIERRVCDVAMRQEFVH